jgi:hypothetical protein
MKAILDVFSGRPNPSWELTPQDAKELARRLTGLAPANRALAEGGLGYRGLTIANPDKTAGLPAQISVFNGVIGLSENERTTYYNDTNSVEDWLIRLARQQGHGAILDQLIGNKGQ